MAIMIPNNIDLYNINASERLVYESLRDQLSDEYIIFYSLSWIDKNYNGKFSKCGECDFLICSKHFGFIALEVKGGVGLEIKDGNWILKLRNKEYNSILSGNNYDGEYVLKRSPFKQAESSKFYFKEYFEKRNRRPFSGIFGHAVCFPFFSIRDVDLGPDAHSEIIIDYNNMNGIEKKIKEIFVFWQKNLSYRNQLRANDFTSFIKLVNKKRWYSTAFGRRIEKAVEKQAIINRVQDNILDLTEHFTKACFVGGAGTGKTFIASKKARQLLQKGVKVLFLCFNRHLYKFIESIVGINKYSNLTISTFHHHIKSILGDVEYKNLFNTTSGKLTGIFDIISQKVEEDKIEKFDAVIIDEAQDFIEEWGLTVYLLLKEEEKGIIYTFYDQEQNIFQGSFPSNFLIDVPKFQLKENLRNTSKILDWTINTTGLGISMKPNPLMGIEPEIFEIETNNQAQKRLDYLLKKLIDDEGIKTSQIRILSDRTIEKSFLQGLLSVGKFKIVFDEPSDEKPLCVSFKTIQSYKGLEADIVIYLQHTSFNYGNDDYKNQVKSLFYVAYTRAKYLLFVIKSL